MWRIVLCDAGIEPRKASKVWTCSNYYLATMTSRKLLGLRSIAFSRYVVPLLGTDPTWKRAETVRETLNCPLTRTRLLQIEYQEGEELPPFRFMVPRPAGICWHCDYRLGPKDRALCAKCRKAYDRAVNTWTVQCRRADARGLL